MPIHDANRVEYTIESGHIVINLDDGKRLPAYWAHPTIGNKFSAICLVHDWWGMNNVTILLANLFAQMGYYVIVPDLFNGEKVRNVKHAMKLVEQTAETRYPAVHAALNVVEHHHRSTRLVAAIGVGMGGSLVFEAAIKRTDLEAAIAYGGFPHRFLRDLATSNTPILALFGSEDPHISPNVIKQLQQTFLNTPLKDQHQVRMIEGAQHEFFPDNPTPKDREYGRIAINETVAFLERYLERPSSAAPTRY